MLLKRRMHGMMKILFHSILIPKQRIAPRVKRYDKVYNRSSHLFFILDFASPVTQTETISPLSNDYTTTSPVSTFGVSKAAQGSMKLGHSKPKKIGKVILLCCVHAFTLSLIIYLLLKDDGGLDSMISALKYTKDERKTELERKREERRQVSNVCGIEYGFANQ